jgi:tetraacyldisaccharide 4'-kinase
MGGSGKTPHTEYLVRLLQKDFRVAILSRGYLRKSKGFILAEESSTFKDIGDEPMQYLHKFGHSVRIAVDRNRCRGVEKLLALKTSPEAIILDDSLQHRFIKPGLNLLLTDYRNLYSDDNLFPSGRLRDLKTSAKRADIIIVTKTEKVLSPLVKRIIKEKLSPRPHQKLYFTYLKYDNPISIPSMEKVKFNKQYSTIILFSGIANAYPLKDKLRYLCRELVTIDFPDHHNFTKKDILLIRKTWDQQFTSHKLIVTTEKDAMRLINSPYLRLLKDLPLVYLPIEVKFHGQDGKNFNTQILNYVRENQRNSSLHSVKNKR